jgi:hypothetical protein
LYFISKHRCDGRICGNIGSGLEQARKKYRFRIGTGTKKYRFRIGTDAKNIGSGLGQVPKI